MRTITGYLIAGLWSLAFAGCVPLEDPATGGGDAPPRNFHRGMSEIYLGGTGSLHQIGNDRGDRTRSVEFTPRYGYFITDRLEVMASLGMEYEEIDYDRKGDPLELDLVKEQSYNGALALQYNHDEGGRVVPFARIFCGLVKSRVEMIQRNIPMVGTARIHMEDTGPFYGARAGIRYMLTKRLATDVGLGWQRVHYDPDLGGDIDDVSFTIGAAFFF